MIVRSQAGLQVASSGNQKTVPCEQDVIVDKLKALLSDYLEIVNAEVRNTKHQVEELRGTMADTQETVSSELEDTRRKMDELQVAVSGNQEKVTSELEDTRRKVDELQVSVAALVKLLNNGKFSKTPKFNLLFSKHSTTWRYNLISYMKPIMFLWKKLFPTLYKVTDNCFCNKK